MFQSLALHDTLTFTPCARSVYDRVRRPALSDRRARIWCGVRPTACGAPRVAAASRPASGFTSRKRIPIEAGLGGGSSDAAAALRALTRAVAARRSRRSTCTAIAASLGADVPFFLEGGTVLGVERGDVLFPLIDAAPAWVVLLVPTFGVSTRRRVSLVGRSAQRERRAGPRRTPAEPATTFRRRSPPASADRRARQRLAATRARATPRCRAAARPCSACSTTRGSAAARGARRALTAAAVATWVTSDDHTNASTSRVDLPRQPRR